MAAVAQERGASCSMRAQAEPTSSQEVEVTAAALEPGVAMGCVQSMHCPGVAGGGRWRCASAWGRRGRVEGVESRQPERDTTDCTRTSNASRGASHSRHGYCEHRLAALVRQGGRPRCRSGERVGLLRGVSGGEMHESVNRFGTIITPCHRDYPNFTTKRHRTDRNWDTQTTERGHKHNEQATGKAEHSEDPGPCFQKERMR